MRFRWATVASIAALLAIGSSGTAGDRNPYLPNDVTDGIGWAAVQWNFSGNFGVGAPVAWANLIASGAPGGSGVIVAVLDTGVGDASLSTRAASDLASVHLVPGWDFVDDDADPTDENGHGTVIASMIAADTNNGFGLTGLAYGARIMPIRVIDRFGVGQREAISRGLRFAVDHGARVINLSFSFGRGTIEADITAVVAALEYAAERGALIVGAAGNDGGASLNFPARSKHVLAVGATTEFGCCGRLLEPRDRARSRCPGRRQGRRARRRALSVRPPRARCPTAELRRRPRWLLRQLVRGPARLRDGGARAREWDPRAEPDARSTRGKARAHGAKPRCAGL